MLSQKSQVSIGKIPGSLSGKNKSETGSSSSRVTLVIKLLRFLTVSYIPTYSVSHTHGNMDSSPSDVHVWYAQMMRGNQSHFARRLIRLDRPVQSPLLC